jgi:hypothetical protein
MQQIGIPVLTFPETIFLLLYMAFREAGTNLYYPKP